MVVRVREHVRRADGSLGQVAMDVLGEGVGMVEATCRFGGLRGWCAVIFHRNIFPPCRYFYKQIQSTKLQR